MFLFNIIKRSPNTPLLKKNPFSCRIHVPIFLFTWDTPMYTRCILLQVAACTGVMSKHLTVFRECKVDVITNTSFVGYKFMHFLEIHRYEQIKEKKKEKICFTCSVYNVLKVWNSRHWLRTKNTCIGKRHCIKEKDNECQYRI